MKWFRRGFAVLLVLFIAAVAVVFWYRAALNPTIDGSLEGMGVSASVDIVRDREGVPHIFAKNEDDAHFALGYVHAQDRLWQMEMNRRIPAGRMAEVLGPGALDVDRFLRTLGVRKKAELSYAQYDAPTQRALQRYADGVNAYLTHRKGPLPIEFLLTGAPAPEPWTPVDSVGWSTMMAWDLSGNWGTEVTRMRLAQRLTKKQIDELLPPYPGVNGVADAPLVTADYTALYRQMHDATARLADTVARAPAGFIEGMGSNNWVVGGTRTESGKPLLANDPHLGLSAPALWYFAQLDAPGLHTIGATLPGLPFVVLGRTDRVAWGFTNTGPDTQDLFIEDIKDGKARTPTGWEPLAAHTEVIHVKGAADVTLQIRESRHGPLITDVSKGTAKAVATLGNERYAVAFQWAALMPGDKTVQAGVRLNHAGNWADFLSAVSDFGSPEQNIVYADIDGNIGFVAPGRVPVRRPDNDLKGQAPAPGWEARYDWTGWIPFEQLPQSFNPVDALVVTANQKVVGDDYAPFLTSEWAAPYRSRRITQLLNAGPKQTVASFEKIQADQKSLAATDMLPLLLTTAPTNENSRAAIELLAHWDGTMSAERAEPAIYQAWMRELSRLVYADELGPELFADYWQQRPVFLYNVLRNQDGQGRWCDDVNTPQVETCDDMKARALDLALADLQKRLGADTSKWRWGTLHPARSTHRPFGQVPWLARIFDLRVPAGGDAFTVDVGNNSIGDLAQPYTDTHGPSLRAIYDLSDLEKSEFIHSTGQSGNRFSRLYANFMDRWSSVRYIPMKMQRASVEENAAGVLVLKP